MLCTKVYLLQILSVQKPLLLNRYGILSPFCCHEENCVGVKVLELDLSNRLLNGVITSKDMQ